MYLASLILNLRHRQVRVDVARPYELHRTLARTLPDALDKAAERLLYRLEATPDGLPRLLVQSHLPPRWDALPPGYLAPIADALRMKEVALQLAPGQLLAFRLVANPTKRLSRSLPQGRDKSQRVGLRTAQEQEEWLARKGAQHGFAVMQVTISRQDVIAVRRRLSGDADEGGAAMAAGPITQLNAQFDGVLQVVDAAALAAAVAHGIGSGKAFGCGLLSLAPAR
jgi:CRISPR system Cascade subunit CasE